MKNKSTNELMKIIGKDRAKYSSDEVNTAEEELKNRSSDEEVEFKNKMKRYGAIAAFIGGAMALWALILVPMSYETLSGRPALDENVPFLVRNFHILFYVAGVFQMIVGCMVFIGGLLFRRFKERGRKLIVLVLGIGFIYLFGFFIFWEISLITMAGLSSYTIGTAIGGFIVFSIFFMIFWIPLKYFRSERVKEMCA